MTIRPVCRLDIRQYNDTTVIFDVAHNPDGLKRLFEAIKILFPEKQIHVLCAFSALKDLKQCTQEIMKAACNITLTESGNIKGAKAEQVASYLPKTLKFTLNNNPIDAAKIALSSAAETNALLVVCGTFYIMEAVNNVCQ